LTSDRTGLPAPLKTFAAATVGLTLLSWLVAYICYLLHMPAIYTWPYNFAVPGSDFTGFQERFLHIHTMEFFTMPGGRYAYPAPLAIFYQTLYSIWGNRPHPILILDAFTLASACIATFFFYRAMRRRNISTLQAAAYCLITLVLSYPLYYEIQRGNVEVVLWIIVMLAVWAFRTEKPYLAAVLIGTAIACKWYPAVLLGLFLFPKKYKLIPIALITTVVVTVFSDWWLGPTLKIAATGTSAGVQGFMAVYAANYFALGYDCSFFALFKFFIRHFHPDLVRDYNWYLRIAAVAATALYFLRIRRLPVINQICVLILLSITLPPVSFDYTLLHLYVCWAVFTLYVIDRFQAGETVPMAGWTMAWFAFAMAPHGYIIRGGDRYCGTFRVIGLIALLYIFLKYPFAETKESIQSAEKHRATSLGERQIEAEPAT
jgi:hypothetical protein